MTPKQKRQQFLKRRHHNEPGKGKRYCVRVDRSHVRQVTWAPKRRVFMPEVFTVNGQVAHARDQHMGSFTS